MTSTPPPGQEPDTPDERDARPHYGAPPPGYGPHTGPSPYDSGAGHPGYYGPPPGQPGAPWGYPPPPQPPGRSNTAKFWIGVALSLPAIFAVGLVTGAIGNAVMMVDVTLGQLVGFGLGIAALVGLVVGIAREKTRYYALGILAGVGIVAILAAGACIVLIASLAGSLGR